MVCGAIKMYLSSSQAVHALGVLHFMSIQNRIFGLFLTNFPLFPAPLRPTNQI